jgi:hypothetical protein
MVEVKWLNADLDLAAIEVTEMTVDDIMIKNCNDIYDEVMRGQ